MISSPPASLEAYWSQFDVDDRDLDFIYSLLLEREVPLTTAEMAVALVDRRLQRLEEEAATAEPTQAAAYLPAETYQVGARLTFPALSGRSGEVIAIRQGENPERGPFGVIRVSFGDGDEREFAMQLEDHILNHPTEATDESHQLTGSETVMERFGDVIEKRIEDRLRQAEDIVWIAGRWFPKALLAEINVGHLNLAEAVLDVAGGGPLPTDALVEHLEMPDDVDPLLRTFSLDYALQEDGRFDEVGPAGRVLWFLKRLEPPEVLFPPPRLEYTPISYDRGVLTESLLDLERSLDDELSPEAWPTSTGEEVELAVIFPHWRVGSLPLSSRLRSMFPTAYEAPRIRFILVDGSSGHKFPGWVVRRERYVFGLDEWYRDNEVPAGGLVRVRRGDQPGEVVVQAVDRRRRNDWIRTVAPNASGQLGFTMLKQPVGTAYDDLMVVGLIDPVALDEAWLRGSQRNLPLDRLVSYVFRELAKLNPQSAVHAQALYSGLNVLRRLPPGPIFAELITRPYYVHVGDLYWRFEDSAWGQS
jgi:hypothetical protein